MKEKLCFAHNVTFRQKPLNKTMGIEKKLFPKSKMCVVSDGEEFSFSEIGDVKFEVFSPPQGHKIGCVNSAWASLHLCIKQEVDIICFSHDDIYISNPVKVKECLQMINEGYDFIGRRHIGSRAYTEKSSPHYNKYIMIENFIMTKSLAEKIVKDVVFYPPNQEKLLPVDKLGSPCCEIAFGESVLKNSSKPYLYDFIHNWQDRDNEMGYFHVGNPRGWV